MSRPRRRTVALPALLLILTGGWFLAGIRWGLPSRAADPFLFGDRTPWTGGEILALTGGPDGASTRAADVDANPLDRSRTAVVNESDRERAEVVRRYRLYSHQPDEMNTFMALKEMKPGRGDLDPKLYKYGGLWVYPVGAILKAGSVCGLVDVRADLAHYLDHPDAFARFYVAARLYTVAWGLAGVWAVYHIVRRITGDVAVGAIAALCFAAMPAVVNAAHEAKPHLPGVVIGLLAVIAAERFVRSGTTRAAVLLGVACGAAPGMVPSMLPVMLVIPAAALLRRDPWGRSVATCVIGGGVAVGVYAVTNPYVPINAIRRPAVLRSHFDNSADFYHFGGWSDALPNAATLLAAGMSPLLAAVAAIAVVVITFRWLRGLRSLRGASRPSSVGDTPESVAPGAQGRRSENVASPADRAPESTPPGASPRVYGYLLGAPAIVGLIQFTAFAAGQPGDYGRFALFPDVVLSLAAVCLVGRGARLSQPRLFVLGVLLLTTLASGAIYVAGFVRDAGPDTTRLQVAGELQALRWQGAGTLATPIEPAPFSMPPVDLWRWRIEVPPRGAVPVPPAGGVAVRPLDAPGDTWLHVWLAPRLGWASKSFAIDFDPSPATSPTTAPPPSSAPGPAATAGRR